MSLREGLRLVVWFHFVGKGAAMSGRWVVTTKEGTGGIELYRRLKEGAAL